MATTSKGNILVYTRTGESATLGGSRFFTHGGSRLFEFDPTGKYVREIGAGIYGFLYAQSVRVDAQDNIWTVDRASDNIIRFDPLVLAVGLRAEAGVDQSAGWRRWRRWRTRRRAWRSRRKVVAVVAAGVVGRCPARELRATTSIAPPISGSTPRAICSSPRLH